MPSSMSMLLGLGLGLIGVEVCLQPMQCVAKTRD